MILTPGNVSGHTAAAGDKDYESRALRKTLRAQGWEPCIPCRSNVKNPGLYDAVLYRSRHAVENALQRKRVFRRVVTRCEKTKRMFLMFATFALSCHYTKSKLWPAM